MNLIKGARCPCILRPFLSLGAPHLRRERLKLRILHPSRAGERWSKDCLVSLGSAQITRGYYASTP